jgi:hypothetical protein
MTESEWLKSNDPDAMLEHILGWTSERKLRLFACACCRRIWALLKKEQLRHAVETSERYADGQALLKELKAARDAVWQRSGEGLAAYTTTHPRGAQTIKGLRAAAAAAGGFLAERAAQADLLRDVVGNPFRTVELNPAWLTWNDGTVRYMAEAIYEERTFEQLPILADALEEAGCADAEILQHCRKPGVHVRGCWVLDLLLGKE